MKSILLIGLGRFGRHIAKKLFDLNHQVMAIDNNEENINSVLSYTIGAKIGDSTNEDFLKTLGVKNFDACIVTIGDDFQNSLETVYLLKELGARKVIARASRGVQEKFLLKNGADEVVYPEKQLAAWTAIRCASDSILDYIELDDNFSIFELTIPSDWDGKSIIELDFRKQFSINVLAIRANGKLDMNITPDRLLHIGESILVLGRHKDVQRCFHI